MVSHWHLEPHIHTRRLGDKLLAHHSGSGDTHALNTVSGAIIEVLEGADRGYAIDEIMARCAVTATETDVAETLEMLADVEIVQAETDH